METLELLLQRTEKDRTRTPGELRVNGIFYCYTLEDRIRELPGEPVEKWKVPGTTAIPSGRFRIELEDSPHFGPDTITLRAVPGFDYIRMHSGNTEQHTEGCVLLGYQLTDLHTIVVGQTHAARDNLKRVVKEAIARGQEVWITILNPEPASA